MPEMTAIHRAASGHAPSGTDEPANATVARSIRPESVAQTVTQATKKLALALPRSGTCLFSATARKALRYKGFGLRPT